MSLLNKIKTGLAALAVAGAVGCSSADKKTEYPQWMIPVNIAAGYFGAIATHEAGHALAAKLGGAKKIKVDILPGRYDGGDHLGYTKYGGTILSDTEKTRFNVAGPLAMYGVGITTRETLKTGHVPDVVQPTLQWYALFNKLLTYLEIDGGLMRKKQADLGKENLGIAVGFLAAQLAYDIYDIGSDNKFWDVFNGSTFYKPKKVSVEVGLLEDGIMLSVGMRF